jgi:hypothetical protein
MWRDEHGFVISSELVLVATILVIGMITGLTSVRDQVVQELADVAGAIAVVNQSYSYNGVTAHTASTAGSAFLDTDDFCDKQPIDPVCEGAVCLSVNQLGPSPEGGGP